MSDKLEALRIEAETLSGLMMQLAENEIDSDSFAVMSDLGENGQEHDCDLPITETALRAAAVIGQLLAALEEKDQAHRLHAARLIDERGQLRKRAEAAEQRLALVREQRDNELRTNTELERANAAQNDHINQQQDRVDTLEKKNGELGKHIGKLEKPIKLPDIRSEGYHESGWFQHMKYYRDVVRSIQELELKVEGE